MRERKVAVARAAGRRRLKVLLVLLGLGAMLAGALGVLHSPLLAARDVTVAGSVHTSRQAVLAAAGLEGAPPLVDVDVARAEARLDALPWVARASVRRSWPSSVAIRIVERTPVALAAAGGGAWALLDATGRVLAIKATRPPGLVLLGGVGAPGAPGSDLPARASGVLAAAVALPASLAAKTVSLTASSRLGVELVLRSGPTALLGAPSALRAKYVSLATVLADVDVRRTLTIDLRVPGSPVLTP